MSLNARKKGMKEGKIYQLIIYTFNTKKQKPKKKKAFTFLRKQHIF